ncbi:5-deoxy-glucuronate isomerase [Streptomyces oceani]|uniref:5-deoxy-glucuronate isomerase n=1 Tax=Streptomyces oceani TaxID=1075402 RepID=UPI0009A11FAE|nr:5-deoxy-glucuronate isomerase [Streptomyces oceani]
MRNHGFHRLAGTEGDSEAPGSPYVLDVAPESAGWDYSALRVLELPPGGRHRFATGDSEWIVLPLGGGCTVAVRADSTRRDFELHGRDSVFSGVTDFVYAPRDGELWISSTRGGRFALAGARCARRLPARYGPAAEVSVELRGRGNCSRQVNNFAAAGAFEADNLIAVEVLTPGGNWSSYPPHKHDEQSPGEESELEEIYYYEIAAHDGTEGVGYQRVTPSGPDSRTDVLAEVRSGDAVLIPDGWHGPSIAAPGHDMYYLNVMAGPGSAREWLIRDHPEHAWIRSSWEDQPVDPRLPRYTAPAMDPARRSSGRQTVGPVGETGPPGDAGETGASGAAGEGMTS